MNMKSVAVAMITGLLTFQTTYSCDDYAAGTEDSPPQQSADVVGWFFRAVTLYPVAVSFEPVVLFTNGAYVRVGREPVDEIDEAADRIDRPRAWGTWSLEGDTYYLTNHEGGTADYRLGSGNWFPAYPYLPDLPLAAAYTNTTGGDYGGGTHVLFQERIGFPQDGYFYHSHDNAVITPGSAAWNGREDAGTYTVADHTMVLTYNAGNQARLSFAIGAKGNPAQPDRTLVFIGGDVFVAEDPA